VARRWNVLHQLLVTSQFLHCLHEAHRPLQRQSFKVRVQRLYTRTRNERPVTAKQSPNSQLTRRMTLRHYMWSQQWVSNCTSPAALTIVLQKAHVSRSIMNSQTLHEPLNLPNTLAILPLITITCSIKCLLIKSEACLKFFIPRSLTNLYSETRFLVTEANNVQCESKNPPLRFSDIFSPNGLKGILNNFLHTYYAFLSMLDYKCLFSYLKFWRSYAIQSETTHQIFTVH